ncbi:MAG: putative Ig domain-containing protein [Betaproteobacteria bacterium]
MTFAGTTATYTPFAGQTGADSFSYRASSPITGLSTDTRTATVVIATPTAPVVSSSASAMATVGFSFSYFISGTNTPTLYGATTLPPGLFLNVNTGRIYGMPTAIGNYSVTISAGNAGGTGTLAISINVTGIQLTVSKAGTGTGSVSSVPAGINNCSVTCGTAGMNCDN